MPPLYIALTYLIAHRLQEKGCVLEVPPEAAVLADGTEHVLYKPIGWGPYYLAIGGFGRKDAAAYPKYSGYAAYAAIGYAPSFGTMPMHVFADIHTLLLDEPDWIIDATSPYILKRLFKDEEPAFARMQAIMEDRIDGHITVVAYHIAVLLLRFYNRMNTYLLAGHSQP